MKSRCGTMLLWLIKHGASFSASVRPYSMSFVFLFAVYHLHFKGRGSHGETVSDSDAK